MNIYYNTRSIITLIKYFTFPLYLDDEIEEDTKVTDTDDDFLLNYFRREKVVMHNMFGPSWREFIKHPDLNRYTKIYSLLKLFP